jgi:excisionase family DNA binding protein
MDVPRGASQTSPVSETSRVLDMAAPDYDAWLTKPEAAARTGRTTKTIQRWAADGKLTPVRWQRLGRGPILNVYNPVQVDEVAAGTRLEPPAFVLAGVSDVPVNGNGHQPVAEPSAALTIPEADVSTSEAFLPIVVAIARRVMSEMSRTSETLFVTIPEAAVVSGLSRTYLKRQLEAGTLKGIRDGRRWRIRRTDLEAL